MLTKQHSVLNKPWLAAAAAYVCGKYLWVLEVDLNSGHGKNEPPIFADRSPRYRTVKLCAILEPFEGVQIGAISQLKQAVEVNSLAQYHVSRNFDFRDHDGRIFSYKVYKTRLYSACRSLLCVNLPDSGQSRDSKRRRSRACKNSDISPKLSQWNTILRQRGQINCTAADLGKEETILKRAVINRPKQLLPADKGT